LPITRPDLNERAIQRLIERLRNGRMFSMTGAGLPSSGPIPMGFSRVLPSHLLTGPPSSSFWSDAMIQPMGKGRCIATGFTPTRSTG
jgi:hypothetical protein